FAFAATLLSSLFVGLVPAWQVSRNRISDTLKDTARSSGGGTRGGRFRSGLVIAEVALSVVLLVGSSLLLLSFIRLQKTPAGFSAHGVAAAFVGVPLNRYPTQGEQAEFFNRVI